jgi:hypothetical protein
MQIVNGNRKYSFADATTTRASLAFCPYTGAAARNNVPRVAPEAIYYNTWEPKTYQTYSGEVEMVYADYLAYMVGWDARNPHWTKFSLGNSFQGRPMNAYRLGPTSRKHFVVDCVMHGNEHDGIKGVIDAMEIIGSYAEFQPLRDEYTILFIPVTNPDGYFLNTRNLANIGPNGFTVNMNRNWDWWWGDYLETGSESKGTAPESEIETQNYLNYWRTGNGGAPTTWAFLLNMHANKGPGARYQSRDRVFTRVNDTDSIPSFPNSKIVMDFHMQVNRMYKGLQTLREIADPTYPDLMTRCYHSRFAPHLHSYFSSQGVPSMITEELKAPYAAAGTETYDTACDMRMDYLIAVAQTITAANWEVEDGVLIEPQATNAWPNNAEAELWSSADKRPQYWSMGRATFTRAPELEGLMQSDQKFYKHGEAFKVSAQIAASLPNADEYVRIGISADPTGVDGPWKAGLLIPSTNKVYNLDLPGKYPGEAGTLALHTQNYGAAVVHGNADDTVDIIGGGTAAPSTGAVTAVHRATMGLTFGEALVGNLNTARMFHAYADNCLDFPAAAAVRGWVMGGYDAAGARLTSIERWDPTLGTSTNMAAVLPTATADAGAAYYPANNSVYMFGGSTGAGLATTIFVLDTDGDALATHATSMLVALKHPAVAWNSGAGKFYIIGGELASGDMSDVIYSFDPATGAYIVETEIVTDTDIEDNEEGVTWPWATPIGRVDAIGTMENAASFGEIYFAGGRLTDGAGALEDDVYYFDPYDNVIGKTSTIEFGYTRYGSAINDTKVASIFTEDFAAGIPGADWDDLNSAWQDGGGFAEGATGTLGWLMAKQVATQVACHRLGANVSFSKGTATAADDFMMILRAQYTAPAAPTDGYILKYENDGATRVWSIIRRVSSVDTVVATVDVSADGTKQIDSTARALEFRAEKDQDDQHVVHLTVIFNGANILETWDLHADRIVLPGYAGFYGGGA